jgi:DNA invertase Pin-like site-specific DNA recombinase
MIRCAVYLRVSTRDQRLVQQFREIRRAVDARAWTIVAVYRERRSGAAGVDRPEWRRLRQDAALHRFSAVAAWSLDRLGRSALEVLDAAQDFERRGVRLLLAKDGLETSGPTGRLVVTILAGVAQLERDMISERTRVGLAAARRRGSNIGRPRAIVPPIALEELTSGTTMVDLAKRLGVSVATIRRRRDKMGGIKTGSGST